MVRYIIAMRGHWTTAGYINWYKTKCDNARVEVQEEGTEITPEKRTQ